MNMERVSDMELVLQEIKVLKNEVLGLKSMLAENDYIGRIGGVDFAAQVWGCSTDYIYALIRNNKIPYIERGAGRNKYRFSEYYLKRAKLGENPLSLMAEMDERFPK